MALSWKNHPILTPPTAAEMAAMEPEALVRMHRLYHEAIENSEKDPYRYGFVLENWRKCKELFCTYDTIMVLGGNRCLRGDTIIYDPVLQIGRRIDEIKGPHHVWAWNGSEMVVAEAEEPFAKPAGPMVKVTLSTGYSFVAANEHRVLAADGRWLSCAQLRPGCELYPIPSTWGTSPLARLRGADRSSGTQSGSQPDCHSEPRLCGEPPQLVAETYQGASPSQAGAPKHTCSFDSSHRLPVLGASDSTSRMLGGLGRILSHSRALRLFFHPSTLGGLHRLVGRFFGIQSCASYTPCKSTSGLSGGREFELAHQLSLGGSAQIQSENAPNLRDTLSHCEWPSVHSITSVGIDVKWDMTVPAYGNYYAQGAIHHNSAKTSLGAWLLIGCCMENPGSMIVCFAQNAELSVLVQQAAVFHMLPIELKQKTLGRDEYISYTKQNGFAGNSLIFPNGSRILFKTYSQFTQNQTVLEGLELGAFDATTVNLGAWCDEYLGGPELIDTLAFRLATRNAKMLLTFTPIEGYTETVRTFLDGAKTLETKKAELLDNRALPYVQKCKERDAAILYMHTKDNPFSGYERVAKEALAKGDESWILCRCYGVPTKSISSKFPSFSREVNVVKHEDIPCIKEPEGDFTRYLILDPAGRKKWFMSWVAVDATETWWVYREWPDVSHGDWAEWRNGKWAPGEGAKRDGHVEGVEQYVALMMQLEREHREVIAERLIDPRLGATKYQGLKGVSTLIDDLANAGLSFTPAPGLDIDDGLQALHNKMAYNRKLPIDASNRPRFYISERCENTIRAIQEYTGDEGKDEAWKDPLDCVRYAAVADIRYVNPAWMKSVGRTRNGY